MSDELITIKRGDEVLGTWSKFEIRKFLANGSLLPTDQFEAPDDLGWFPLLTPYRRKYNFFDWDGDDDTPWYYVKNGCIHGPRTADEIDALAEAGVITDEDFVTFVGALEWLTFGELGEGAEAVEQDNSHWNAAMSQVKEGNLQGAAINAGLHLWQNRSKEKIVKFFEPKNIDSEDADEQ